MELTVRTAETASPDAQDVEVVERKGIGHPDTICDALAEEICRELCRHYLERFGAILHHNVDKILLCGGAARPAFAGGEVIDPIELYLAGRATAEYDGARIPVADIAVEACRGWLRAHLPALDVERHVRIVPKFRSGSSALRSLFSRGKAAALSNDTSCGAGFAPLTPLEQVVLEVERTLNGAEVKRAHPAIGQDIKVMGVRHGSRVHLTISCAMIGRYLHGVEDYVQAKAIAAELAVTAADRVAKLDIDVAVNVADDPEGREVFLTVTGTSAEAGDDGEAGRGNRASGLITPYRPMTVEAAAGKNPVTHVGKLYNLAAIGIAAEATRSVPGVRGACCVLVSQIGRPIDDPQIADVCLALEPKNLVDSVTGRIRDVVNEQLQQFPRLQAALLEGTVSVY
jgi:S-adenosylmethionine synthetase